MSKQYKRLNPSDERRLVFYENAKKFVKKGIKWWTIGLSITSVFMVGLVAFCITLDKDNDKQVKKSFSTMNISKQNPDSIDDTQGLDELAKKEFERESDKDKIISDSIENINNTTENKKDSDSVEAFNSSGLRNDNLSGKFCDFSSWNSSCKTELMVVNSANPLAKDFKVKTKICRGKEINAIAADKLEEMICDAKKDGIVLWISSGYRSIDLQTRLFKRQIEREKSKAVISQEEAERRAAQIVARPNTSEHNTGLAIDFNGVEDDFYKTKEYKWLMDNAHKYGFIERYQEKHRKCTGVIYEPWHFRYVGCEIAPLIKDSGLCLEEYVENNLLNKSSEGN